MENNQLEIQIEKTPISILENKIINITKESLREIFGEAKKDKYGWYIAFCNSEEHIGVIKKKIFNETICIKRHCRKYEKIYIKDYIRN